MAHRSVTSPDPDARRRRLTWLLAFVGFFLATAAWSTAAPYNGTPDEKDHVYRAYGVATGQVVLTPEKAVRDAGAFVDVPRGLLVEDCWQFRSDVSAACATEPGGDDTRVAVGSGAGRYFPLYYAVVGWPLALSPDWLGVMLARLVSAALCAVLLANALTDAMRWSRYRVLALGVLLGATPMVAHMGSAINPSGPELAAGIAFFAAACPLLYTPAARRDPTLLWHVGVAALGLASLRMAGPLFLFLAVVALLLPLRWAVLRDLWEWRGLRWWMVGVGSVGTASVIWTVTQKTADVGGHFVLDGPPLATTQIAYLEAQRWRAYLDEMVGVTSWLDTRLPEFVYVVWLSAVAAVVLAGFVLASRLGRLRIAALALAGVVVPFLMTLRYANEVGFITQGRYLMPLLVGVLILAMYHIAEHGVSADRARFMLRAAVIVLLPLHFVALAVTMVRWQHGLTAPAGLRNLNPFSGDWHPPLGSAVPLLALIGGVTVIGVLVWRTAAVREPAAVTEAEPTPRS